MSDTDNNNTDGQKKPRGKSGIADIASKLGIGKKKEKAETAVHSDGNGDHPTLTADMIEAIQQVAAQQGMVAPQSGPGARLPMDQETAIKLLDYLCRPEGEREAELTNLTHVQSHIFAILRVFEEAAKDTDTIPDLTQVYRRAVYGHRRSVNALLLKELTELAGLQSQDEAIKSQGIGSPLGQ